VASPESFPVDFRVANDAHAYPVRLVLLPLPGSSRLFHVGAKDLHLLHILFFGQCLESFGSCPHFFPLDPPFSFLVAGAVG